MDNTENNSKMQARDEGPFKLFCSSEDVQRSPRYHYWCVLVTALHGGRYFDGTSTSVEGSKIQMFSGMVVRNNPRAARPSGYAIRLDFFDMGKIQAIFIGPLLGRHAALA
ncbi:hypothetical protein AVEN_199897-1 [Araneus ventricosus]|uniref:Uncharacterized protein n=1 Tax=Araneus ventricosus TaxID=182803 RepID=A0A4Y2HNF0_ARAVE|nr:hypothetical protein AVEN_199897-1 [Araneus ventricosus]